MRKATKGEMIVGVIVLMVSFLILVLVVQNG